MNVFLLDGATGTNLNLTDIPEHSCPEQMILDNPETLILLQSAYKEAGSCAVYAPTFGANGIKLRGTVLEGDVATANARLVQLSKQAVGEELLIAGGLAATGGFMKPMGELELSQVVEAYREQALAIAHAGVDFFVIETMMDIREAVAALGAVKSVSDKPVFVTMTFDESGKTLTGTSPEVAAVTLIGKGAAAVGANCSTGPDKLLGVIQAMAPYAAVPLIAKPNAGMPRMEEGKAVYDVSPEEFASYAADFVASGAYILGGCCGTTPAHIQALSTALPQDMCITKDLSTILSQHVGQLPEALTSPRNLVHRKDNPAISEKISICGDKDDVYESILDESFESDVIHIDLDGAPVDNLWYVLGEVPASVAAPLVFSGGTEQLRAIALTYYPGRTKLI